MDYTEEFVGLGVARGLDNMAVHDTEKEIAEQRALREQFIQVTKERMQEAHEQYDYGSFHSSQSQPNLLADLSVLHALYDTSLYVVVLKPCKMLSVALLQ